MEKKNVNEKDKVHPKESEDQDPFLRRIKLQGIVLKKLLAEVGQQSKPDINIIPKEEV
ncbi:MAG: hypothetical protein FD166_3071 [Bacteroidetes bacterium]|nr:MAG: hypothetical protein FD166_3071 [Bacteroidota bacterium]